MTTVERLRAPELGGRLAAVTELAAGADVSGDELQALAECLGSESKALQRRAADVCSALHGRGVAVAEHLLAGLHAGTQRARWGAAYALARLGALPAHALPVLLECLGVDDGDLRWAAADILVHLDGVPERVEALRQLLATGNAAQRKMAAYCLRDMEAHAPDIEPALWSALDDTEASVRLAALSSLTRVSTARAALAQRVATMLDDAEPGVRRAAAAVLGTLGEPSAPVLEGLRVAAANPDPSLQRAAARALRQLGA